MNLTEKLMSENHHEEFSATSGRASISPSPLREFRGIALKRLNALWIRLERDLQYLILYREFMQEYEELGHMREVTVENDNPKMNYFLPHHGVYRL
ncbi:hypothetical protein TNCV_4547831 [Trichonephila clavipes]|nr:hypothetical protein TNCV_4547831 [Trichonephila clavipes]